MTTKEMMVILSEEGLPDREVSVDHIVQMCNARATELKKLSDAFPPVPPGDPDGIADSAIKAILARPVSEMTMPEWYVTYVYHSAKLEAYREFLLPRTVPAHPDPLPPARVSWWMRLFA